MHGALAVGFGVALADQVDPTVQPARGSFLVFLFMATATVGLLVSMVRHLRRADANLGSARRPDLAASSGVPALPDVADNRDVASGPGVAGQARVDEAEPR